MHCDTHNCDSSLFTDETKPGDENNHRIIAVMIISQPSSIDVDSSKLESLRIVSRIICEFQN